ncbi:MAG: hypothetical protein CMJ58_16905 [Planctomycetaceae bacterium]|nr:hypothetical protein [Planctomycetaceae bacterium]
MSTFMPKDEMTKQLREQGDGCQCFAVMLDETSVINLPIAMALLGLSEESTKKWYAKYNVPRMPGAAWLTTGRRFFRALERYFEEQEQ